MSCTVVLVSSQLVTTLSALAYLRSCKIEGADLRVLSLERLDQMHSAHAFEKVLVSLAARDGHRCVFEELSALPQKPERLVCDYLLLPRVDHKQGRVLLQRCLPNVVIELGESIGVETKLYSFQARRLRHHSMHQLLGWRPRLKLEHSYLVPLDRDVNQSRMQHFLDCCSCFSAMVGREPSLSQPVRAFVRGEVLLCLPYLKAKKWHLRVDIFGRVKGIKCSPRFQDWQYFLTRVQRYVYSLKTNGTVAPRIFVQVHPKNHQHLELIEKKLIQGLRGVHDLKLEVLPCDTPLEIIASGLVRNFPSADIQIAGFGTNILSAAAFLGPQSHSVTLCDERSGGRIKRLWDFCFDVVFNRRELMRQRHVRKALNRLMKAMS